MLSLPRIRLGRYRHPNHARGLTGLGLWVWRSLALVWAAGWTAFTAYTAAPHFGSEPELALVAVGFGLGALGPVLLAWAFPRFGGLVLVGLGVFAAAWAHSESSRVGIVVPALGLGAGFLVLGTSAAWQRWRTRRKAVKLVRRMERQSARPPAEA